MIIVRYRREYPVWCTYPVINPCYRSSEKDTHHYYCALKMQEMNMVDWQSLVYCACLENRCGETHRGFESLINRLEYPHGCTQ